MPKTSRFERLMAALAGIGVSIGAVALLLLVLSFCAAVVGCSLTDIDIAAPPGGTVVPTTILIVGGDWNSIVLQQFTTPDGVRCIVSRSGSAISCWVPTKE